MTGDKAGVQSDNVLTHNEAHFSSYQFINETIDVVSPQLYVFACLVLELFSEK